MSISAFAILLLLVVPRETVICEQVDLVEKNSFYDENGRLVFDQIIFYDWHERALLTPTFITPNIFQEAQAVTKAAGLGGQLPFDVLETEPKYGPRHQVIAWRLLKHPFQLPLPDHKNGGFYTHWNDGADIEREVYAKSYRETFYQYDPELVEREFLPKEKRRELKVSKPRTK
jgi:hypothetical protein